jgi:hypothetical protein
MAMNYKCRLCFCALALCVALSGCAGRGLPKSEQHRVSAFVPPISDMRLAYVDPPFLENLVAERACSLGNIADFERTKSIAVTDETKVRDVLLLARWARVRSWQPGNEPQMFLIRETPDNRK